MTDVAETGAINRRQKSGADFWRVCHANQVPVFVWYRILANIRTLQTAVLYSKPETGMHVTEMMICDWSLHGYCLFFLISYRPKPQAVNRFVVVYLSIIYLL